MSRSRLGIVFAAVATLAVSPAAFAMFSGGAVPERFGGLALGVFAAIIALTMYVTYLAAKRVKTTQQLVVSQFDFQAD